MNGDERKAERVRKEEEDTIRLCVHRNHLGLLGMGKLEGGVGGGGRGVQDFYTIQQLLAALSPPD